MLFLHPAKLGVVRFQYYDLDMCQGAYAVVVLLSTAVRCPFDHYGFPSSILRCAFVPALVYLVYCHSAEIDWSPVDGVPHWFLYCFTDGRVLNLIDVVVLPQREDMNSALGAAKLYASPAVICVMLTAKRCSLVGTTASEQPSSRANFDVSGTPPVFSDVSDVCSVDLEGRDE